MIIEIRKFILEKNFGRKLFAEEKETGKGGRESEREGREGRERDKLFFFSESERREKK